MFEKSNELDYVNFLQERFRAPAIMLHRPYPPIGYSSTRSRLGGLPNLPDDVKWPIGKDDSGNPAPLHFLAQIDCSQLPAIDSDMPSSGMLFFFGFDSGEQLWCDYPTDSVRVIYCEAVATDQAVRTPPSNLKAICEGYRLPPWLLQGEAPPTVHTSWPLVPLQIDSWPEASAIYGMPVECNCNENRSGSVIRQIGSRNLFRRSAQILNEKNSQKIEFSKETNLLYERRLQAARVAAILLATELPTTTELEPKWGSMVLDFHDKPRFIIPDYPEGFPQIGLMVDRIARLIVRKCISLKESPAYHSEGYASYLNSVEESGYLWIERVQSIGLENTPSDEERSHFNDWIRSLGALGEFNALRRGMQEIFTHALLSCVAYASDKPEVMSKIPEEIWKYFEAFHLPFSKKYGSGSEMRITPLFHQMLGHARAFQDLDSIEDTPVLLLQLQSDHEINMVFGDAGSAYFWINREDLKLKRFDRVWGDIIGH